LRVCVEVNDFDLDLSMYPSFVSSIYDRISRNLWIKVLGNDKGRIIYLSRNLLCCEGENCDSEVLSYLSGSWCEEVCLEDLERRLNRFPMLKELLIRFSGLKVIATKEDPLLIASAVVLSRRTAYYYNVRRWMRYLFRDFEGKRDIKKVKKRTKILKSPQARVLSEVIQGLAETLEEVDGYKRLREELLKIKYIGPKTADAIALFLGYTTEVAPPDVHLMRFANKVLGLKVGLIPSKILCMKGGILCKVCRYSDRCLEGIIVNTFRRASGFIQTLAYVYDTLGLEWRHKIEYLLSKYYGHYMSSEGSPSGV
jgi:endonuclease III